MIEEGQLRQVVQEVIVSTPHQCSQLPVLSKVLEMQQQQQMQIAQILELQKKHDVTLYGTGDTSNPGMVHHMTTLLDKSGSAQWLWRSILGVILSVVVTLLVYIFIVQGGSLVP
jgi:hypothetical protein